MVIRYFTKSFANGISAKQFIFYRILLFGLFSLGVYFFEPPLWQAIIAFCFVQSFGFLDSIKTLSLSNIVFWLTTTSLAAISTPYSLRSMIFFQDIMTQSQIGVDTARFILLMGFLVFLVIYFTVFKIFSNFRQWRYPVTAYLIIFLLLGFTIDIFRDHFYIRLILSAVIFAISKTFWVSCFQLSEVDTIKNKPFWQHFGTLSSPWQSGWGTNCVVRGYTDYVNHKVENPLEVLLLQWSAVKLVLFCSCLRYVVDKYYDFFIRGSMEILGRPFGGLGTYLGQSVNDQAYLNLEFSRPLAWAYLLIRGFGFLMNLTAHTNLVVGIARMCKFSVRKNVDEPYLSTSFNNFLGRIYYYYIAMLQRFFFYPILARSRPLRQRHLRIFVVHFLTIFSGGFLTYMLRFAGHWAQGGFSVLQEHVVFRLPYIILLATFSGLSALAPKLPEKYHRWQILVFLSCFYAILYFLCFSLNIGPIRLGLPQRISAFLFLFGL